MKLFPLLVLLLAFTACAPAPTGAYDVNTQALFLAQTRDAAGDSANVFAALAMETAIAQTATRQATLDAQNDTLTHTANELAIANATAEAWERRGWLSPEQSNVGRPGKNGRALLPPLADLAKKHGIAMSPKAHHVAHVPHVLMSPKAPPA